MSEEKLTRAAIVTGGSRGIGRAVCVALAKQGCNVVVNYCHGVEPAEQTAALCRAEGVQAVTVQADVSTAEGCKALFDAAAEAFGRVDVLVNNAGITRDNLILRLTEQDFDAVLDTNLKSAFLCCKEAARRMVRQVQNSVYMEDTLRRLGELGVDHILEVGPGSALSGFVKKTLPGVPCASVETPEQLDAALAAWRDEA